MAWHSVFGLSFLDLAGGLPLTTPQNVSPGLESLRMNRRRERRKAMLREYLRNLRARLITPVTLIVVFALVGPAAAVTLNPGDILVTAWANVGSGLHAVVQVDPTTGAQTLVSSGGNFVTGPVGIAIAGNGDLFVLVVSQNQVQVEGSVIRVDAATGAQTVVSSGGSLSSAYGFAIASNGDFFVSTFTGPGSVIRVDPTTGAQTVVSSGGSLFFSEGIAVASNGDLFVTNFPGSGPASVIRVDPATAAQMVVSSGGSLGFPYGIAIASNGDLFVTNQIDSVIRVDPTTGAQTVVSSGFVCPDAIAIDANGDLLVGDSCQGGAVIRVNPTTGAQTVVTAGGALADTVYSIAIVPVPDTMPPTTSDVMATPNPVAVNMPVTLTATISDVNTGGSNVFSAEYHIDGGPFTSMSASDGSFDSPTENVTAGIGPFAAAGVYTICVRGTDAAGGVGPEECIFLAVYDPTAGFVTGGGWINSPLGAYAADPTLTGRANFGFVSKYQKGANVPTGETEFRFQVANLNFHSDTYEWLVVAGARAQYKGTGTINGMGNLGFLLTAIDGQMPGGGGIDKFRIKIWDKSTRVVVYDNQMGAGDTADPTTAIAGGSIVIHSK